MLLGKLNLNKKFIKHSLLVLFGVFLFTYLIHPGRFATNYEYITTLDYIKILHTVRHFDNAPHSPCQILKNVNKKFVGSYSTLYNHTQYALSHNVNRGGWWAPEGCEALVDVAIIVPYRDRSEQLSAFLHYMHPYLQVQSISYRIIVIEQSTGEPFNRGMLMNIGYKEALKLRAFPCFIFHDVDLLPENIANIYACAHQPRHMSCTINIWRYNLLYNGAFGGVIAMLSEQFSRINGFSNVYFGWGAEDDDLLKRIKLSGMNVVRLSPDVSRYFMLSHKAEVKSPDRFDKLQIAEIRHRVDGLSNLFYKVISYDAEPLCTKITVELS